MSRFRVVPFLLALFVAPQLLALQTHDTTVVLPIIGRFPGAAGTQWRTDLFLGNRSSVDKTITMTYYPSGGSAATQSVTMTPFSVTTIRDVVLSRFGFENSAGQLILSTTSSSAFEARARIYNAGNPAGEFGQSVPGIGLTRLARQGYLFGLSGIGGNRVNAGVANPLDRAFDVTMVIFDAANVVLHREEIALQPHQTVQFNDIFTRFGIAPREGIQINFGATSTDPADTLYGYASEVRNDTGDAVFVFGTNPNS